jgi:hypothetical protein
MFSCLRASRRGLINILKVEETAPCHHIPFTHDLLVHIGGSLNFYKDTKQINLSKLIFEELIKLNVAAHVAMPTNCYISLFSFVFLFVESFQTIPL